MPFLQRLFARRPDDRPHALYAAVVAEARRPRWYAEGGAPDTLDGRFDMVAAVLSVVLVRLEGAGEPGRVPSARLAELFVEDMDGQLREQGVGDVVVGKHVGRMMSALGGRLAAYREGLSGGDLDAALVRNLWRGTPPAGGAGAVAAELRALASRLAGRSLPDLLDGRL